MNINEIEAMAEPQIRDYVLTNSRVVGEEYIPPKKARVYGFDELIRKYDLEQHWGPGLSEYDVQTLFYNHLPFKVLISEAPFCYAVELNKDNFVHILESIDYIPKHYLSGVSFNLPLPKFMLEIEGEQFLQSDDRIKLINRLAEAWKLW